MSTITFQGKDYEIESLSPKAQALITLVQRADEQLTLFSVSKESLLRSLEVELGEANAEANAAAESPPEPKPKRATRTPITLREVVEKQLKATE